MRLVCAQNQPLFYPFSINSQPYQPLFPLAHQLAVPFPIICYCQYTTYQLHSCGCPDTRVPIAPITELLKKEDYIYLQLNRCDYHKQPNAEQTCNPNPVSILPFPCYYHSQNALRWVSPPLLQQRREEFVKAQWTDEAQRCALNRRLRKARTSGAGVKEVVCPETGTVKRLGGKGVSGRQDITSSTFKGKGGIWPRREKLVKVAGSEVVRVAERGAAVTIARAPRWREMSALERVMERRKRDEAMGNWFLERTEAAGEDLMVGWRNEGREENMIMDWRWFEDRISGNPKVTGLEWWNKDGSWSKGMWAPVAGGKLYVQGATELSEKQLLLNFETLFGRRGVEERRTAPGRSPAAWEM